MTFTHDVELKADAGGALCDCQQPEEINGIRMISNSCPIHNENPDPSPASPALLGEDVPAGMECCGRPPHVGNPTDGYTPECCERYVPAAAPAGTVEETLKVIFDRLEQVAFRIPPMNTYTPELVQLCMAGRNALTLLQSKEATCEMEKIANGRWGCLRCDTSWETQPAHCSAKGPD